MPGCAGRSLFQAWRGAHLQAVRERGLMSLDVSDPPHPGRISRRTKANLWGMEELVCLDMRGPPYGARISRRAKGAPVGAIGGC